MEFALNQKSVGGLGYEAFLDLAAKLGCVGVEPRNDLGRPLFDGLEPAVAGRLAKDRGLRLVGLSEVYPFNEWNAERAAAVRALVETAAEAGAETVSLVPSVEPERSTLPLPEVIEKMLPLFAGTDVVALIEPIGFAASSLKHKADLAAAIRDLGVADRISMVHDTFQHALVPGEGIHPQYTRMVHISGISNPDAVFNDDLDKHRVLVDAKDRVGNIDQIRAFLDAGYDGPFSFEATAPEVIATPDPETVLRKSMGYIEGAISNGRWSRER